MDACGCHLCPVPSPPSRILVSPGEEFVHLSGALFSAVATQGLPLDFLVLLASRSCVHKSHRTETNREGVLNQLHSGHSGEAAD